MHILRKKTFGIKRDYLLINLKYFFHLLPLSTQNPPYTRVHYYSSIHAESQNHSLNIVRVVDYTNVYFLSGILFSNNVKS